MEVLDNIPVKLDVETVLKRMHARSKDTNIEKSIQELIQLVRPVAKPKAVYEVSYIENKNEDSLDIGGVKFTSRVLRINLEKVERVFPYIATCGRELEKIVAATDDLMRRFWLDTIKGMALETSVNYLSNYLERKYALGQMSSMSPGAGSQDLWPIEQKNNCFQFLVM